MNRTFSTIIILLLSLLSSTNTMAQTMDVNPDLSTPHGVLKTHLDYLGEDNFRPEIAARVFNPEYYSQEEAERLAIKLMQVYKGIGIGIYLDEVPKTTDYFDSTAHKHIYQINSKKLPDVYLQKSGKKWYYSNKTAELVPVLHKQTYPYGSDRLLKLLPKLGGSKMFGLHMWQYLGLLIIILLAFITHKIFTAIIQKIIVKFLVRKGYKHKAKQYILPVARPGSILIIFPILLLLVPVLQLPIKLNNYTIMTLKALWPVFATVMFYRLVDVISAYLFRMAEKTESTLDDQLVPLIRKALKTFVVIVGFLGILSNLDIDIIPILTGLSIGGLAVALAAQDTLKNLFGSIMIFVDRPFQIGDWITAGDIDGTVEEVGFRSTRVRTFRNSVVYVPNGHIADRTVDNHGLRRYRRFYTHISVTYDTPVHIIELFVDGLRKIVDTHPHTWKDNYHVYLNDLASSSLNIMFYIFFEVPTWGDELRCRHEVLLKIISLAQELGVNFAFPTQTLHMETFPEKKGNSPEYIDDVPLLKSKLDGFFSRRN